MMKYKNLLFIVLLMIGFILTATSSFAEWSMLSDRTGSWDEAGVDGGIPNRTYVRNGVGEDDIDVVLDYSADNSGTNDCSTAIQNAVNACSSDGDCDVVYLPAGTYYVNGSISVPSGITIRGAGRDSTTWRIGQNVTIGIYIGHSSSTASPYTDTMPTNNLDITSCSI